MALYEFKAGRLISVRPTDYKAEGIREEDDLRPAIRGSPELLGEELLIIGEEFNSWKDCRREIDLLAVDRDGNLVVIEIKLTSDGGHAELQAIRYAALIKPMTWRDVVESYRDHLRQQNPSANAENGGDKTLRIHPRRYRRPCRE